MNCYPHLLVSFICSMWDYIRNKKKIVLKRTKNDWVIFLMHRRKKIIFLEFCSTSDLKDQEKNRCFDIYLFVLPSHYNNTTWWIILLTSGSAHHLEYHRFWHFTCCTIHISLLKYWNELISTNKKNDLAEKIHHFNFSKFFRLIWVFFRE